MKHSTFKRILITGGAGFIGQELIRDIKKEDPSVEISILDNFSNSSPDTLRSLGPINIVHGDVRKISDVRRALKTCPDIIVHLAAVHYIPYTERFPVTTHSVNCGGTKNILDCVAQSSLRPYIIFASSASVYAASDNPHKETEGTNPNTFYGKSKVSAEKLFKDYETKIKGYIILRLFNVYGSGDNTPHLIPSIYSQIKRGSTINVGSLEPSRDYVYVSDVADAIHCAIKKRLLRATINVGTGKAYSVRRVINEFEKISGKKVKIIQDQKRVRSNDVRNLIADTYLAISKLGWKSTTSLESGLRKIKDVGASS